MKINLMICGLRALLLLIVVSVHPASALTISDAATDGYWGAEPTNNWSDRDIIGNESLFGISKMDVTFNTPDGMYIDIYTTYLNNIGAYQTQLGDLFISTDGWHPAGTGPHYVADNFHNSSAEDWEYALVMDTHVPDTDQGQRSGDVFLYRITDPANQIKLSWAPAGYIFRQGQEAQYLPSGDPVLAVGSWSFENWGDPDSDDFLRMSLSYEFGDVTDFGFHYTFSCGNDVVEGAASVPTPEPASMVLLATGFTGLSCAFRSRIRRQKNRSRNDL